MCVSIYFKEKLRIKTCYRNGIITLNIIAFNEIISLLTKYLLNQNFILNFMILKNSILQYLKKSIFSRGKFFVA